MPPISVSASFWRGGTSRGLLFRAETLAPFPPSTREKIIKTALGSPDPAARSAPEDYYLQVLEAH